MPHSTPPFPRVADGYDPIAVDDFVQEFIDEVQDEIQRLREHNATLYGEIDTLQDVMAATVVQRGDLQLDPATPGDAADAIRRRYDAV